LNRGYIGLGAEDTAEIDDDEREECRGKSKLSEEKGDKKSSD